MLSYQRLLACKLNLELQGSHCHALGSCGMIPMAFQCLLTRKTLWCVRNKELGLVYAVLKKEGVATTSGGFSSVLFVIGRWQHVQEQLIYSVFRPPEPVAKRHSLSSFRTGLLLRNRSGKSCPQGELDIRLLVSYPPPRARKSIALARNTVPHRPCVMS